MALLDDHAIRADSVGLTELPHSVFSKSKLRELVVSRNLLTSLPPALSGLAALRVLRVDRNALTTVPPEIGMLAALVTLDLSGNRVRSLPASNTGPSAAMHGGHAHGTQQPCASWTRSVAACHAGG